MKIVEMDTYMCVTEPNRKVYINSVAGRNALASDAPDIENYDEMIGIWGDEPTYIPEVEELPDVETEPTTEERLTALEETTTQQGEILNILLSGDVGDSV